MGLDGGSWGWALGEPGGKKETKLWRDRDEERVRGRDVQNFRQFPIFILPQFCYPFEEYALNPIFFFYLIFCR